MSLLNSRMVKFCIAEILIAIVIIGVYFYYKNNQENLITFEPFALSANDLALNSIPSTAVMEGTSEGDLMIAAPEGSKIFAKGGLNYVIGNQGPDEFYYSLCSTKIIDNKVNVIEGFNPANDKLKIFCGHHPIRIEDVKVLHGKFKDTDITYIFVKGEHVDTAIALIGNIDINTKDIILNEKWNITKN